MKKILIINSCFDCPYVSRDYGTRGTESICFKTLDDDALPKKIENVFRIPEWCELEDYKKGDKE